MTADYGHIPDHQARARAFTPGWRQGAQNLGSALDVLVCEVQELEDAIFDVWVSRHLDGAHGLELDRVGRLLGPSRQGLSDLDYRGLLRGAALSLTGNGHPDRLMEIVAAGTRTPIGYLEVELLRRAVIITYVVDGEKKPEALRTQLKSIVEASTQGGVSVQLIEAPPAYLGFLEDPDALGLDDGYMATVY